MKLKVSDLKKLALKNGGFSLNSDGLNATSGFMVSCKDLYKINLSDLIGGYIGGWLDVNSDDKNNFYLDISINVKDKDEAIELAKKNNQLAIFDIATGESIYL